MDNVKKKIQSDRNQELNGSSLMTLISNTSQQCTKKGVTKNKLWRSHFLIARNVLIQRRLRMNLSHFIKI